MLTDRNEIHIVLQESNIQLDDVIVMGPSISEDFAVERLESIDIYLSPGFRADPLKAVSVMAASTNVSESANTNYGDLRATIPLWCRMGCLSGSRYAIPN